MADSLLQIASATEDNWGPSQQVESGNQLKGIRYKIDFNGRTAIRVVFPIYTPNDVSSIPADAALMTADDWQNVYLVTNPDDGVTANRNGLPIGVYDITLTSGSLQQVTFVLSTQSTLAEVHGTVNAVCKLQYSVHQSGRTKWVDLPDPVTVVIKQNIKPPAIVKFTADRVVIVNNSFTTLRWEVINAEKVTLYENSQLVDIDAHSFKGSYTTGNLNGVTNYKLMADSDGGKAEMPLSIIVKGSSAVDKDGDENQFDGQQLLGLYTWGEKLYSLILYSDTDGNAYNVLLWESYDGQNWSKTNVYSKTPSFQGAQQDSGDPGLLTTVPVKVPVGYAGSPGVVFRNKLYLIGGSRFDVNFRSNSVFFLDFTDLESGWQQDTSAGFSPRMGQACVVKHGKDGSDEEVWVIGGYDDQGPGNDVWTFDGSTWKCISDIDSNYALPANRCMLSALADNGVITVYGGFGSFPGAQDQNIANSYLLQDGRWQNINVAKPYDESLYVNCTAVITHKKQFLISTIYTNQFTSQIQQLVDNGVITPQKIIDTYFDKPDYIFSIQAVDFKDVVWLCVVSQGLTTESNALNYFTYVDRK